jgi:hypothetical protein
MIALYSPKCAHNTGCYMCYSIQCQPRKTKIGHLELMVVVSKLNIVSTSCGEIKVVWYLCLKVVIQQNV